MCFSSHKCSLLIHRGTQADLSPHLALENMNIVLRVKHWGPSLLSVTGKPGAVALVFMRPSLKIWRVGSGRHFEPPSIKSLCL